MDELITLALMLIAGVGGLAIIVAIGLFAWRRFGGWR